MGARARTVVIGTAGVRSALKREELAMVVAASDHSERTEDKVLKLARAQGVPVVVGPDTKTLGRDLGRDVIQVVGVKDASLAKGIADRALDDGR